MRICVADDDTKVLEALSKRVTDWGYEPVVCRDGVDAWRTLGGDDAPPIAILDWDLPGLSAPEICRMLRATPHGAGVYVIVMGARTDAIDLLEAREAGVDDFVAKPVSPRELQFRIAKGVAFREGRPRPRASSIPPSTRVQLAAPSAPPTITLGGRYRLDRKLAEGSTANVWLGVHLSLGVNVAIKFMKPDAAENLDYARFEREARAAAQLRHDGLVRVHGYGSHEGLPYVVTEHVPGELLSTRLARRGPMAVGEVAALVAQLADVLAELHARGMVHGDVRPENVWLVEDDERPEGFRVKLAELGGVRAALAQRAEDELLGMPSYTSPEVLKEETGPNPALDLWALAATAFAAATGAGPFSGSTLGQVYARVCVDPIPVASSLNPNVPASFDAWFGRACARAPGARFGGAAELTAALRTAPARTSGAPRRPTPRVWNLVEPRT